MGRISPSADLFSASAAQLRQHNLMRQPALASHLLPSLIGGPRLSASSSAGHHLPRRAHAVEHAPASRSSQKSSSPTRFSRSLPSPTLALNAVTSAAPVPPSCLLPTCLHPLPHLLQTHAARKASTGSPRPHLGSPSSPSLSYPHFTALRNLPPPGDECSATSSAAIKGPPPPTSSPPSSQVCRLPCAHLHVTEDPQDP